MKKLRSSNQAINDALASEELDRQLVAQIHAHGRCPSLEQVENAARARGDEWIASVTHFFEFDSEDDADYQASYAIGRALARAVRAGCRHPWIRTTFERIEMALASGSPALRTVVVTGMLEAMQNEAYESVPRDDGELDELDDWLGPRSLVVWKDMIESFSGAGIRTIAEWRKKTAPRG